MLHCYLLTTHLSIHYLTSLLQFQSPSSTIYPPLPPPPFPTRNTLLITAITDPCCSQNLSPMAADNGDNAEQMKSTTAPAKVRVVNTSMVAPSKKTETERPASCPLITFDVPYITFYYNQKLLLYKTPTSDEGFRGAVERMKEGLAAALDHFYPLAGKIAKGEDGSLIVDCSAESLVGAEVIDAAAEDVSVEELAEGEAAELLQEVVPYTGIMNLEGLHRPLLAVQVTLANTTMLCFELEHFN